MGTCCERREANGADESGSDAADDLDQEDEVEDSDEEVELVQEPASTGTTLFTRQQLMQARFCSIQACFQ